MKKVEAIIRPERFEQTKVALTEAGFAGLHVQNVTGRGAQRGVIHSGRGGESYVIDMLPKIKLVIVVRDDQVDQVTGLIIDHARTGNIGDGKIFVLDLPECIRIRTGETGADAL